MYLDAIYPEKHEYVDMNPKKRFFIKQEMKDWILAHQFLFLSQAEPKRSKYILAALLSRIDKLKYFVTRFLAL
jgi:hypothetical protein